MLIAGEAKVPSLLHMLPFPCTRKVQEITMKHTLIINTIFAGYLFTAALSINKVEKEKIEKPRQTPLNNLMNHRMSFCSVCEKKGSWHCRPQSLKPSYHIDCFFVGTKGETHWPVVLNFTSLIVFWNTFIYKLLIFIVDTKTLKISFSY